MENNNLTPEESFSIINKAIANFKLNFRETAKLFLLWGWVLAIASLSNFLIIKILNSRDVSVGLFSLINWVAFILIGFILMLFLQHNINKDKKVFSYIESHFKNLWTVTAASFFIATLLCIKMEINPPAIMLLIAGIATTTSGLLIKYRPLIIGGMSFFIFSLAATFVSEVYLSLIVFGAIICGYLIPGYLLKSTKE
jgi:hypothetical protein